MDRIQYSSFSELTEQLQNLISHELPVAREHKLEGQLFELRTEVLQLVGDAGGLRLTDIAKALNISTDLAKLVVRPMIC